MSQPMSRQEQINQALTDLIQVVKMHGIIIGVHDRTIAQRISEYEQLLADQKIQEARRP